MPFPRVLVLFEMQSVLSRIWTHVAVSISYDDNHYTTHLTVLDNCRGLHNVIVRRSICYSNYIRLFLSIYLSIYHIRNEVPVIMGLWEMRNTSSLSLLPGLQRLRVVALVGQIKLNCVLMLNWIAWNMTVLTFKMSTFAKPNCLKKNSFWNWNCTYS